MAVVGLQTAIWSNRFKTLLLLALFPTLLFGVFFAGFLGMEYSNADSRAKELQAASGSVIPKTHTGILTSTIATEDTIPPWNAALIDTGGLFTLLGPVLLIWALISFAFHRQIIFGFTDARAITRKEYPEIYNIVENLCISRGLPMPQVGILEDDSLNAFAVGWRPEKSWIVFSRGILEKLSKPEIEAVAGHELTHIMNRDGLLMITIIVFIGAIAGIGEILFRIGANSTHSKDSDSK